MLQPLRCSPNTFSDQLSSPPQGLQQKAAPTYVNCSQNQAAHEVGWSGPTNRTWKGTALQFWEIKGRVTQAHGRRMPRQLRTTSCTERVPLRHSRAGPAPSASCSQMGHCAPTYFIVLNVPLAMLLQLVRSVPGSVDKEGVCYCVVHLPSNRMALQQLEQLESMAQALMGKYEQELSRVSVGLWVAAVLAPGLGLDVIQAQPLLDPWRGQSLAVEKEAQPSFAGL